MLLVGEEGTEGDRGGSDSSINGEKVAAELLVVIVVPTQMVFKL